MHSIFYNDYIIIQPIIRVRIAVAINVPIFVEYMRHVTSLIFLLSEAQFESTSIFTFLRAFYDVTSKS